MKLLNLGCGGNRPKDDKWTNIDNLHAVFPDATCQERINMDAELNYFNHDLRLGLPFEENSADGVLMSHFMEHLNPHECVRLCRDCYKVLRPGGILRVSIPDPKIFHELSIADCQDWGQPIYEPSLTFMEYALFFSDHKQLLSKDALQCIFWLAGFRKYFEMPSDRSTLMGLADIDNRQVFSLFMEAQK